MLDLDYAEDSNAEADANFVLTGTRRDRGDPGHGGEGAVQRGAVHRPAAPRPAGHGAAVRAAARGRWPADARASPPARRLVLASHNPGKLARDRGAAGAATAIEVVSAGALGLPEPEETEPDFAGNARLKALAAARAAALPALADDSGFCVAGARRRAGRASRRAGPGRTRISPPPWRACSASSATTRTAAPGSSARSASPGPTAPPRAIVGRVDGTLVFPPRGDPRLRLRPDLRARRRARDLWRDGPGPEGPHQPPRPRLRPARRRLPAARRSRLTPARRSRLTPGQPQPQIEAEGRRMAAYG